MFYFDAEVYKTGYIYQVELPTEVSNLFSQKGNLPVKGIINNQIFKGTLTPRKNKNHVLYLNRDIRKKAGIFIGNTISVQFETDTDPQEIEIADDIELLLKENGGVWHKFLSFSSSHKRELLLWIYEAKHTETRLKRIYKLIQHITSIRGKK